MRFVPFLIVGCFGVFLALLVRTPPLPLFCWAMDRVFKLLDEKDNARERRRKVFEYFNTAITRENK